MKPLCKLLFCLFLALGLAPPALAGQPEARAVALGNNCTPKKIEVYQQSLGADGQTVYRIECNLPKTVGETTKGPDAILVSCTQNLCDMLRPVSLDKK
jgi:hypothetical protein